ncbi:leucyl/phenylalanyl-tRNA--protein transferase [Neisseria meningitidis]|nr:leucyl/phenylalanyl-tRNA--protein transferase [Neisseria meningitidis]MBG8655306.1 leucyl/phenylalanyl-tRNA--protein transferase [Neisseria meningitidis]MBG8657596.1 leucyl/phenylalanyl-tRNA--protein transferase [Neisseria meningitidis]MBG8763166.1 leucyl/phenylalanyl-tRNA--protein transferase [Neisseria meningitidis]MBG8827861.1 leucyl/phenylalanyl-tRNA--protein transferase [Neisseria meningitidis]
MSSFAFAVSQNKNDTFRFFFILNDCVLMVLRKGRLKVYICRFIRIKCFRRPQSFVEPIVARYYITLHLNIVD